ncbi:MAG TPA: bifunctional salicylyl-CoA 5-hydroxylase/oxidoreductase [Candidatus Dormibacteraeota bacterium]
MKIVCAGGGPGGLLLGILLRLAGNDHRVTLLERNRPDDAFGFGVVFSDETLDNLRAADPTSFARIEAEFRHWSEIDVVVGDRRLRSGGHGFAALGRQRLLNILAERAQEVGVDLRFTAEVVDPDELRGGCDLLVGADGVNSTVRRRYADHFRPTLEHGRAKYIWLGTARPLQRFTFIFVETEAGLVQAHVYPYSDTMSSFIVEMDAQTWSRAGLDRGAGEPLAPGASDPAAMAFAERVFAGYLDGHPFVGNNSRWLEFVTVSNETWHHDNVVLIGDAAHTAHFSIGSGTKLAMEDAIALADALGSHAGVERALEGYEAERRPLVASTQRAAHTSREWFEGVRRYRHLDAEGFAFQMLTRSQRVTYDNLRLRDEAFVGELTEWMWRRTPPELRPADPQTPPMFYPFELRGLRLANRIVVSSMAQYCAVDGVPDDWHLVHLGSRAVGGAGLVMTEMTCVSPIGRITPGCTGLWNERQGAAFQRVVEFVHRRTAARIGLQLGHSGRKGSTDLMWIANEEPLPAGNWEVIAPSPLPYMPHSQVPREMTRADIDEVIGQFVRSATLGAEAGFDLLELHFAHGYLVSSFLSPVTNRRTDEYGGSLDNRMRLALETFDAVRAVWPEDRPMAVRISATDWIDGGFSADDAVSLAVALKAHGCDLIDASTGNVDKRERPRYGRLWQTPFSDRIRHEADIATMAVGGIASIDDVNTIILAGRADLCAIARPHLVDPYWTLNAAIDQGNAGHPWPNQYLSGRTARRREQQAIASVERDVR